VCVMVRDPVWWSSFSLSLSDKHVSWS